MLWPGSLKADSIHWVTSSCPVQMTIFKDRLWNGLVGAMGELQAVILVLDQGWENGLWAKSGLLFAL